VLVQKLMTIKEASESGKVNFLSRERPDDFSRVFQGTEKECAKACVASATVENPSDVRFNRRWRDD
jgi:hypothetical protein